MANDAEIEVKITLDPLQELDRKKLALLKVKEVGFKAPDKITIKQKFTPTSAKWKPKTIEEAARAYARYDLSLFAAQLMENYAPFEKATNGQDKLKAAKAFNKKVPTLYKALKGRIDEKIEDLVEEVGSGGKENEKALAGAAKALDGKPAAKLKKLIEEANDHLTGAIEALKFEMEDERKKPDGDKAAAKYLPKAIAGISSMTSEFSKNALACVQALLAAQKEFSKKLKSGLADTEAADAKRATTALKNEGIRLGAAVKETIGNHTKYLSQLAKEDYGSKTAGLVVSKASALYRSAEAIEQLMEQTASTYEKKAKDAKAK